MTDPTSTRRLEIVDVSGNRRSMGRSHGEQRREQIAGDLRQLDEVASRWKATRRAVLESFGVFRRMFERVAPELIDEMTGIAEGSGRTFDEILFLNARHGGIAALEAAQPPAGACTAFAAAGPALATNGTIAGQNKDTPRASLDRYYLLRTRPDTGARIIALNYPGEVGEIGMGSRGVAVFSNALFGCRQPVRGPEKQARRAMLETQSVDEAGSVFDRLEHWSGANYLVADRRGHMASFEIAGGDVRRVDAVEHLMTHGNHVTDAGLLDEEEFPDREPQSMARAARLEDLLRREHGRITPSLCATVLSDHEHAPHSICRHGSSVHTTDPLFTTCALIADLENLVLHVCLGNPCENQFVQYGFD